MITVFNRREVSVTFDASKLARVREVLTENGIDYKIKCVRRETPVFGTGSRTRSGSFGINVNYGSEFYVYVKKEDFSRAKGLIS